MLGARLLLFRLEISLVARIEPLGTILAVFAGCSGVARRAYLPRLTLPLPVQIGQGLPRLLNWVSPHATQDGLGLVGFFFFWPILGIRRTALVL